MSHAVDVIDKHSPSNEMCPQLQPNIIILLYAVNYILTVLHN